MTNQPTKFEVPNFTRYGDMKSLQNVENGVIWVVRGQPRLLKIAPFDTAHMSTY